MGKTISEKILSRASSSEASADDFVEAKVDIAMSHDNAALVSKIFSGLGVERVWDPERIIIPIDHRAPANLIEVAESHREIREFVRSQDITHFYDIKAGICHQILPEFGHVIPGDLIVGSDSHTTTYGALGAFGTGIGASEMAVVWATGKLWLKVPSSVKIRVSGSLRERVSAKDVILQIIGTLGADGVSYQAVEYHGETIRTLSISGRLTICNMTMEMDAKAGIVPSDERTIAYVKDRVSRDIDPVLPDPDAEYEERFDFDVSNLEPMIACPHRVDNVRSVREVSGILIHQAVLGSCTNGRLEDLKAASTILHGKKVHKDVRLLVVPASMQVYLDAMEKGILRDLVISGAVILNPGCGPCLGSHQGILARGETAITTTNRNFRGRMGHRDSNIYLASPETVAASAIAGQIQDPRDL